MTEFGMQAHGDYVEMTLPEAVDNMQALLAFGQAAQQFCEKADCFNVLVHANHAEYSSMRAFEDKFVIQSLKPPENVHVAILAPNEIVAGAYDFAASVFATPRILDLAVFLDRPAAVAWLQQY